MKRGLMRYLWQGHDGAGCEPGLVKRYLERVFELVSVGYVAALDKIQIACWDADGNCRLCVWYQWSPRTGLWHYAVAPGFRYREIDHE